MSGYRLGPSATGVWSIGNLTVTYTQRRMAHHATEAVNCQ